MARGYCEVHYSRLKRYGTVELTSDPGANYLSTLPEPEGDCIEWPRLNDQGYGRVTFGGVRYRAHRLVWTQQVGPIPEGLELDHLCNNRACVNINHLEPVTGKENKIRQWLRRREAERLLQGGS